MSTQEMNSIASAIAAGLANGTIKVNGKVNGGIQKETPEQEIARLTAENKALAARRATAAAPKIAAERVPQTDPSDYSKADHKLLEIIAKFRSPERSDGKAAGTFAVKVHAYFHACGVSPARTIEIVEDANKRGVISRMTVPTRNGNRMMLYFDGRIRQNKNTTTVTAEESEEALALFGK